MTTIEQLKAARALITEPECWTRDAPARDKYGRPVHEADKAAVSYCMLGALTKVTGSIGYKDAQLRVASVTGGDIIDFNDAPETTHEMALAAFDKAIGE